MGLWSGHVRSASSPGLLAAVFASADSLFQLLVGSAPFFAEEISETYERIVHWQVRELLFPVWNDRLRTLARAGELGVPIRLSGLVGSRAGYSWVRRTLIGSRSPLVYADQAGFRSLLVSQAERPSSRRIKAFDWFSPIDWSQPRSSA